MSDIAGPLIFEDLGTVTEARFAEGPIVDEIVMSAAKEQFLDRIQADDCGYFVLDLERITFLSSGALGHLLSLHQTIAKHGGHFRLRNVHPNILEVLVVTRLDKLFGV